MSGELRETIAKAAHDGIERYLSGRIEWYSPKPFAMASQPDKDVRYAQADAILAVLPPAIMAGEQSFFVDCPHCGGSGELEVGFACYNCDHGEIEVTRVGVLATDEPTEAVPAITAVQREALDRLCEEASRWGPLYMGLREDIEAIRALTAGQPVVDREVTETQVQAVDAFATWLSSTPDAIARLRYVIRTATYSIERSAHGDEAHYALDGARALLRVLMEAGVFAPFSSPEFPEYARVTVEREAQAVAEARPAREENGS